MLKFLLAIALLMSVPVAEAGSYKDKDGSWWEMADPPTGYQDIPYPHEIRIYELDTQNIP